MAKKKKVAKKQQPKKDKKKVVQVLVHKNKVDRRKSEGWKVIKPYEHRKFPGGTDLVLMEKYV